MQPAIPHPDAASFWDKIAPKYARQPVKDPTAYALKLDRIRALLRKDDHVLEIGCGTGSTALHLAPAVAKYVATDISREMIAIAEGKQKTADVPNAAFVQADAAEVLPEAPFDVIMGFSLLHLVDDVPQVLTSVFGQLRPGGLFLSKTVCLGDASPLLRLFVRSLSTFGIAPRVSPLSRSDLSRALVHAGFDLVETRFFSKGRLNPFIVAQRPY